MAGQQMRVLGIIGLAYISAFLPILLPITGVMMFLMIRKMVRRSRAEKQALTIVQRRVAEARSAARYKSWS